MPIDRARLTAKFVVERLRVNVNQQLELQFPGAHSGPRKLLKLISGLLDTAEDNLVTSGRPGMSGDDVRILVEDAFSHATMSYQCLELLKGASADDMAFSIVGPLQRWFDQVSLKNDTLFRAQLKANYELARIQRTPFMGIRTPSQTLKKAIAEVTWPLLIVTVPAKAFGIIPHLAVVAHEIGHELFRLVSWSTDALKPDVTDLHARLTKRLGHIDSKTQKALRDIYKSWFEELCADAFMFYLTGPAGYFSLSDCLQLLAGPDGYSHTHPAAALRRQNLFRRLMAGGEDSFAKVFKRHTGVDLTEEFNSPLLRIPANSDEIFSRARTEYEDCVAAVMAELHLSMPKMETVIYKEVLSFLKNMAPGAIYEARQFDEDLSAHLSQMLSAIPPTETGDDLESKRPTEFATILNVGWTALLTKLPELRVKTTDPAKRLETLHSLLLKAVELSEARRSWARSI